MKRQTVERKMGLYRASIGLLLQPTEHHFQRKDSEIEPEQHFVNRRTAGTLLEKIKFLTISCTLDVPALYQDVATPWCEEVPSRIVYRVVLVEVLEGGKILAYGLAPS